MPVPFVSVLRDLKDLVLRHRVIACVDVALSVVLAAFSVVVGWAPMILLLAPIFLISLAFFRIVSGGKDLAPRRESLHIIGATAVGVVLTFALIQLVPYGKDHTNPPVTGEPQWADNETRELMVRACFGCHSNQVEYPSYASVAPISWMVQAHIDEGREKANYSEWDKSQRGGDDTIEVIKDGSMPPGYYTRFGLHPEANLTSAEVETLVNGLLRTPGFSEGHGDGGRDHDDDDD